MQQFLHPHLCVQDLHTQRISWIISHINCLNTCKSVLYRILLPAIQCDASGADEGDGPDPRYGHAAWIYQDHMFVFGGKTTMPSFMSVDKRDHEGYPPFFVEPYNKFYLNDLWAFDLDARCWDRVLCAGLPPSPRADFGQTHSLELPTQSYSPLSSHATWATWQGLL